MEKQPWDDLDIEDLLTRIDAVCDQELAHVYADDVLCSLLRSLGYNDIVDAYDEIGKWYS